MINLSIIEDEIESLCTQSTRNKNNRFFFSGIFFCVKQSSKTYILFNKLAINFSSYNPFKY